MKLMNSKIVMIIIIAIAFLSIILLVMSSLKFDHKVAFKIDNNHQSEQQYEQQDEQQATGVMVQHLHIAINSPTDKNALNTITKFADDSRYYLMIRGWLVQKLSGVESRLNAQKSPNKRADLIAEVEALKQAIRAIDLE
ncbi:hypothetical protein [Psychromonas arctica]|uniref:hypothetical protein n=1 Tax=Psychromonas arctica TaxID=168275 RepID=UPI00042634EB|nr:hypothetical protein [Psychromonas arctica]